MKKNIITKISLILFMTAGFVSKAKVFIAINDSVAFLEVRGKILKNDNTYGVYKVLLISDNVVQETKIMNDERAFTFSVPNNKNYMIKVIKKGYADKVVYVNAGQSKSEYSKGLYRYEFVVKMESWEGQSDLGLSPDIKVEESSNISDGKPEFNWNRKYCKKVTPLPQ